MSKKLIIGLGIGLGVLVIILIIALSSSSDKQSSSSEININKLSEKERYAKMSAEFACEMSQGLEDSENLEDAFAILEKTKEIADKYGFTATDLTELQVKYQNDLSLQQLALEEIQETCPELFSQIQMAQ